MAPTPEFRCSFAASPELIFVPLPDFKKFNVVAASRAYLNSVNSKTEDFLGKRTIGIFGKNLSGTPPGDFYDFLSSFFQVIEKKLPTQRPFKNLIINYLFLKNALSTKLFAFDYFSRL